jgi:hypothetical protein
MGGFLVIGIAVEAPRHCEERSDEAIQEDMERWRSWIASLRSQ